MADLIQEVSDLINEHWVKVVTAAGFTVAGWLVARWRANRDWRQREFFHRINVSLNTIQDGALRIRTLSEKTCSEVFLNETAVRQLMKVAQQTTVKDPIIPIPQDDCWYFLNAVLNEVSEQFAEGLVAREAGKPVTSVKFLICLTNECDGRMRTRKIRALVIRRQLLEELPEKAPKFERPHHHIRWETLVHMAATMKKEPWRFIEVELVTG